MRNLFLLSLNWTSIHHFPLICTIGSIIELHIPLDRLIQITEMFSFPRHMIICTVIKISSVGIRRRNRIASDRVKKHCFIARNQTWTKHN